MHATDGFIFLNNVSADTTSAAFTLEGGVYVMDVVVSASGTVTLQRTGPDLDTQIAAGPATTMTATGTSGAVVLPVGNYTMIISGLRGVYASLTRVAGE